MFTWTKDQNKRNEWFSSQSTISLKFSLIRKIHQNKMYKMTSNWSRVTCLGYEQTERQWQRQIGSIVMVMLLMTLGKWGGGLILETERQRQRQIGSIVMVTLLMTLGKWGGGLILERHHRLALVTLPLLLPLMLTLATTATARSVHSLRC